MLRSIKLALVFALLAGLPGTGRAFSLLGIYDTWQTAALGYQKNSDIGGPMNLSEGYRWNTPVITYSFDRSFLLYFGQRGVDEIEKAIKMMNDLPTVSSMSSNLTEFPLDAKRVNYTAQALGILDLKTSALQAFVEKMGLAQPERYTWCLRDRQTYTVNNVTRTNYLVTQRNFDPVTWSPSRVVNGTVYSYTVEEPILPGNYADAIEFVTDPLALTYSSVASLTTGAGSFLTGITRDDAGGLRYLYRYQNYAVENLPTGVTNSYAGANNGGYIIWFPTNFVGNTNLGGTGTNTTITTGLRPGVEKVSFQRVDYDSLLGQTLASNYYDYVDIVITNSTAVSQYMRRSVTAPDILFTAEDLGIINGGAAGLYPVLIRRNAGMVSNDALNGNTTQAGPGVIEGPTVIAFSYLLPGFQNDDFFFDESTATRTEVWGAYDGTTNAPVIFPSSLSIQDIERRVQTR
jgi:hypothetical protein